MYKIATVCVSGATAVPIDLKPIPRGITGAVVEFRYDDSIWAGLRKKVAFRGSAETEDICDSGTVTFPAEVAQKKNARVTVGITGVSEDGSVIIPTLWADLGSVRDSAYGNYPAPGEPVPPVWAQLLTMIGDLKNLDTEAKDNLVNAVNEAMTKGGSGGSFSVYTLAEGETIEDAPKDADVVIDPYAEEGAAIVAGVYTLSEGETIDDAPADADVVIDPYAEPEMDIPVPEADISLNVEGASVGQTVKIAAVDEAGKPTAWEAVEMPSGSNNEYTFYSEVTLEEDANSFTFTEDAEGNPLALDEVFAKITHIADSGYQTIFINGTQVSYRHSAGKGAYENVNLLRVGDAVWGTVAKTTDNNIGGMNLGVSAYGIKLPFLNGNKINQVKFACFNTNQYKAGTKIVVWGR